LVLGDPEDLVLGVQEDLALGVQGISAHIEGEDINSLMLFPVSKIHHKLRLNLNNKYSDSLYTDM